MRYLESKGIIIGANIMNEKSVEKKLVDACKKLGMKCPKVKIEMGNGFPDRMVFHKYRQEIFFVEVKYGGYYVQTKKQNDWQKRIEEVNAGYFLIGSEEEMDYFIETFIKKDRQGKEVKKCLVKPEF